MRKAMLLVVTLLVGCEKAAPPDPIDRPMYCAGCKEIRALYAKIPLTEADLSKIKVLRKKLAVDARNMAAYNVAGGDSPIELHPGCDCPCHFVAK